ncbi:MAG: hypothetical protein RLZZ22_883 [Pseudomonadota bacterium]
MNFCNDYDQRTTGAGYPTRREPAAPTVPYRAGSKRLENLLQAISYGVAVLGALCLVAAVITLLGMMEGLPR